MLRIFIVIAVIAITSSVSFAIPAVGTIDTYFSPRGGVTQAVVKEIENAQREVLIQAYSFTSKPIAKAIIEAKKRGVSVIAVIDKGRKKEKYTEATFLKNAGCMVLIDSSHAIAHNKIIIIDRSILITGSFNFTKAAEVSNAENLLIFKNNQPLVDRYFANFEVHKRHSDRLE